jgi:hypothetical protein
MKLLIVPALLAGVAAAALAAGGASAQAPGPTAGEVLVTGLLQPKGIQLGPDGMLYVAESGTGGDTEFEVGEGDEATQVLNGYTGRISKIDPGTGERTTVADGLASSALVGEGPEPEAVGPADVAFVGGTLYYLQTHAGDVWGFPDFETGIYRIDNDGEPHLVADIGAFNIENPVVALDEGTQVDNEPGGNPYSMDVRGTTFYVVDGNHNRLLRVSTTGNVSEVVEFPDHPVSTGIDFGLDNQATVALLGQGPFAPEDGQVVSVDLTNGEITEKAAGVSMLTDVEFGPGNQLYALSFNDTTAGEFPAFGPFTGSIQKVNADGTMSLVVGGLSFATFLEFDNDTAYVSNFSVTSQGEIVKIENFSTVEPPSAAPTAAATTPAGPVPTATRPGGIGGPDTGSGAPGDGGMGSLPLLLLAASGIALSVAGVRLAARRAR